MPITEDGNALDYLDNLYNSISKGSAYYIPKVEHMVEDHGSEVVTLNLKMADDETAAAVEPLFAKIGLTTSVEANNPARDERSRPFGAATEPGNQHHEIGQTTPVVATCRGEPPQRRCRIHRPDTRRDRAVFRREIQGPWV